ncbi:hypothetical protein RT97_01620 [Variovorax paradoxus]|uniref:Uncharacterized protein n=2 Tax=Variovorax paradoxus TaxID=34073 RepID=A0A0D0N626_VARPD|nr:hypothetical protein RT97_01620 [Variovorax paradoxus]
MATRIMAGRSTPKSSRPTAATTPSGTPPMPPTDGDAFDLLENKVAQLRSLLWCCYGDGNGWFEEAGEKHRANIVWIAADLAMEVEELVQGSVKG